MKKWLTETFLGKPKMVLQWNSVDHLKRVFPCPIMNYVE